MNKEIIMTDKAPAAIGPYSQAVKANGFVFISGQIALQANGKLVEGDIDEQTKQVMENLKAILEEANSSFAKVCKSTIYLKDLNAFEIMNEIYAAYFQGEPPARATVEVSNLPKNVLVEIDMVALE